MTIMQRIKRIRCWLRGYHIMDKNGIGKFRYDRPGICRDCGPVGTGDPDEDGE